MWKEEKRKNEARKERNVVTWNSTTSYELNTKSPLTTFTPQKRSNTACVGRGVKLYLITPMTTHGKRLQLPATGVLSLFCDKVKVHTVHINTDCYRYEFIRPHRNWAMCLQFDGKLLKQSIFSRKRTDWTDWLIDWLIRVFNGMCSTARLYRALNIKV